MDRKCAHCGRDPVNDRHSRECAAPFATTEGGLLQIQDSACADGLAEAMRLCFDPALSWAR